MGLPEHPYKPTLEELEKNTMGFGKNHDPKWFSCLPCGDCDMCSPNYERLRRLALNELYLLDIS